jgi:hypothetical protein
VLQLARRLGLDLADALAGHRKTTAGAGSLKECFIHGHPAAALA